MLNYRNKPESTFFIIYRSGESGDAIWQPVSGTRHKFYVYSAFCDDRDRPLVRIIAATKTKKPDKVGKIQINNSVV